ncbi:hypothetical protein DPMN_169021 [Dreissena polymorpha]|uniref:Uncharacterized protein n=1 Tax=Dreissena polymorpha TaxID=45954 RepID=A0A9D4F3W2_DREPO|nr:hypothetical protein DPMN_169021 [Dreissena polymorpha]
MGIIASITPGARTNFHIPSKQTSMLNTRNKTKIPILEYRLIRHACHEEVFEDLPRFLDYDKRVNILWEFSFSFKKGTPSWQGMMHILHQGSHHPG